MNTTQAAQRMLKGAGLDTMQELAILAFCDERGLDWVKKAIETLSEKNKAKLGEEGEA